MFNGDRSPVWEDEKVLEMDGGDGCSSIVNVLNAPELRLKMVNVILMHILSQL